VSQNQNKHIGYIWLFVAFMNLAAYLVGNQPNMLYGAFVVANLLTAELYIRFIYGILARVHRWWEIKKEEAARRRRYQTVRDYWHSGMIDDVELERALRLLVADKEWDFYDGMRRTDSRRDAAQHYGMPSLTKGNWEVGVAAYESDTSGAYESTTGG
jgi:hypothetical protein